MTFKIHQLRILRRWHGRIGLASALFLLFLALTGLALNHSGLLDLDNRSVTNSWLLRWYGLHPKVPELGYVVGPAYFSWDAEKWVIRDKVITTRTATPVGAVMIGDILFIATRNELYLYRVNGQLIDKISGVALPAMTITMLGNTVRAVVLRTPDGDFASEDGVDWKKIKSSSVTWSAPQNLPDSVRQEMAQAFSPSLPLQRVLLDVHSGRALGRYGPIFVDILAILLIALSVSGTWIYWRTAKQRALLHERK